MLPEYEITKDSNRVLVSWQEPAVTTDTSVAIEKPAPAATTEVKRVAALQDKEKIRVSPHFPSFVATLQQSELETLAQVTAQLESRKLTRVEVVGHADSLPIAAPSRHIFADNQALSEARARNVAAYLTEQLGIPSTVITMSGLGANAPVADNDTEAGRALNRRVEISLVTESAELNNVASNSTEGQGEEIIKLIITDNGIMIASSTFNNPKA